MELSKISNQELLGRMDKLVRTERKITHVILCHINEVDARRLYSELGFESMFKYLTGHCGYGEDSAYRRLQAAKVLRKAPDIAVMLEDGSLNLTQLTQVQRCLKQEAKTGNQLSSSQTLQVLEQIQNKSSYETKKVLAVEFNQPIQTHEAIKPQRDESVRFEVTLTPDQMKDLSDAKDLLSHVLPDGNWAEVISYLARIQIQKVKGKERKVSVSIKEPSPKETATKPSATQGFLVKRKRQHIKISDRRELLDNADHRCEYVDLKSNKKCQSSYQLQIDHRIPLARGGSNSMDNLRVLCRTHNLLAARHWGL